MDKRPLSLTELHAFNQWKKSLWLLTSDGLLWRAARQGRTNFVRHLLGQNFGKNAVYKAVSARKHEVMLPALLEAGAPLNNMENNGNTPLIIAIKRGRLDLVQTLVKAGADINAQKDNTRKTPLMHAARHGEAAIAKFLLSEGADLNLADANEKTVRDYALQSQHKHTIEIIASYEQNALPPAPALKALPPRPVDITAKPGLSKNGGEKDDGWSSLINDDNDLIIHTAREPASALTITCIFDFQAQYVITRITRPDESASTLRDDFKDVAPAKLQKARTLRDKILQPKNGVSLT